MVRELLKGGADPNLQDEVMDTGHAITVWIKILAGWELPG